MYDSSFWDTVAGQRLADMLVNELPKLANRKQYIETVSKAELPRFLKERLEKGERFITSFDDVNDPNMIHVILEVSLY